LDRKSRSTVSVSAPSWGSVSNVTDWPGVTAREYMFTSITDESSSLGRVELIVTERASLISSSGSDAPAGSI
jgi:hypothetical protein